MELRGARQTEELSRDELMRSRCSVKGGGCREPRTSPLKWGLWHLSGWKSAFDLCFCSQVLADHLSKINTRRLWTSHHNPECFKHTLPMMIISNYLETFPFSYFPTQPFFQFIFVRLLWIHWFDFSGISNTFNTKLYSDQTELHKFLYFSENDPVSYWRGPSRIAQLLHTSPLHIKVCMYRRTAPTVSKWWTAFRFFCHSIKRNPSLSK